MSAYKKTLFLTNKESSNKGMAILTLLRQNKGIFCTIKAYNFGNYSNLVLGIKCEDKIIKQNINLDGNIYNFLLNQEINLEKNLGCVLLENSKDNIIPLLWGSEKADNYKSQIVGSLKNSIQKLQENNISYQAKKATIQPTTNIDDIPKNEEPTPPIVEKDNGVIIENINSTPTNTYNNDILDNQVTFLDKGLGDAICPTPHNSNLETQCVNNLSNPSSELAQVVTMSNLFESDDEEIENSIDKELSGSNHKFYSMIAEQLDELFDKYPREKNLENLVENSKWVKIKYEDNDKYYVVGIIYINNDIKYICYGVPGNYYTEPPRELKDYSQWLPTDTLSPYTEGFWVMYQDADTGENVIIN